MSKGFLVATREWVESKLAVLNRNILPLGTYNIGVVFSNYHNYSCKAPTSIFRKDRYLKINSAVAESGAIDVMLDTNTENLSFYTMSDVSNQYVILNITVT